MFVSIIMWLVLLATVYISYFLEFIPKWIPPIVYGILIAVKASEKIGNYRDDIKKLERDFSIQKEAIDSEMEQRGLTFSGERKKQQAQAADEHKYQKRKLVRKFRADLIQTLFLN